MSIWKQVVFVYFFSLNFDVKFWALMNIVAHRDVDENVYSSFEPFL